MEPIIYCDKCLSHYGFLKTGNSLPGVIHPMCGGTVKTHKPVYVGIFFNEENHKRLLEKFPAIHKTVFGHHLTLGYGRHMDELYPLGREITVEVTQELEDDRGQCVIVRPDFIKKWLAKNQDPHITISCADGVKPAYSNDMVAQFRKTFPTDPVPGVEPLSFKITGTLDYFPRIVQ